MRTRRASIVVVMLVVTGYGLTGLMRSRTHMVSRTPGGPCTFPLSALEFPVFYVWPVFHPRAI